jgi:hypothetical protein
MSVDIQKTLGVKLTKKFFMDLPEGVYLVSNVYEDKKNIPAYADKVGPLFKREEQWEQIVKTYADQRLCNVFKTKKDYLDWFNTIRR